MLDGAVGVENGIWAEVDVGRGELFYEVAEGVGFGETRNLVVELKAVEDVLDFRGEAEEICFKVGAELLLVGDGFEVFHRELRCVVERVAGGLAERAVLMGDAFVVQDSLLRQDIFFGVFQHGI